MSVVIGIFPLIQCSMEENSWGSMLFKFKFEFNSWIDMCTAHQAHAIKCVCKCSNTWMFSFLQHRTSYAVLNWNAVDIPVFTNQRIMKQKKEEKIAEKEASAPHIQNTHTLHESLFIHKDRFLWAQFFLRIVANERFDFVLLLLSYFPLVLVMSIQYPQWNWNILNFSLCFYY